MNIDYLLCLCAAFLPLLSSIVSGLAGSFVHKKGIAFFAVFSVFASCVASSILFYRILDAGAFSITIYSWAIFSKISFKIGFLLDNLSTAMMLVVTFISLMVHIYTIGYMKNDEGYKRFFCYISLFTFAMMMLVMSNNFLQLFFGWEAVGVVSYLLIGFWFTRPTAIVANMKAFIVNRVGDLGFLLGIALIFSHVGSLDYSVFFEALPGLSTISVSIFPGVSCSLSTLISICLFIGAMGKSAQIPLHVWLPDSMEGPTPISALIHAATMVTAGIFMVTRMSALFELSDVALVFIMAIGALTAFLMGILAIVQNDIKRIIAYSTLSQLGYMTVALGASAYRLAIFHLITHAFFKALLFLSAGSVITGMHHEQDIRKMGGLRKYMPVTCITSLIGSLSLVGFPFLSGFYSKDLIINSLQFSNGKLSEIIYYLLLAGVFITAFYSFRMYFMVFHGNPRWSHEHQDLAKETIAAHNSYGQQHFSVLESPIVITIPLIILSIPSILIGLILVEPLLSGNFLGSTVTELHSTVPLLATEFTGWLPLALHAFSSPAFFLASAGIIITYYLFVVRKQEAPFINFSILKNNYYFDIFYSDFLVKNLFKLGVFFWSVVDTILIDEFLVNGTAKLISFCSNRFRSLQSGLINFYLLSMLFALLLVLFFIFFWPSVLIF